MRKTVRRDRAETCLLQIFACLFFTPHGTQAFPALRERHSHAVHARDGVEKRPDRVFDVLVHVAGAADVLHEIHAVGFQGLMDALEHVERLGLVVYRIKGHHEIERVWLGCRVEGAEIGVNELDVLQACFRRFVACMPSGFAREIHTDEAASRIELGKAHEDATPAAPSVEHSDAFREPLRQSRRERKDVRFE